MLGIGAAQGFLVLAAVLSFARAAAAEVPTTDSPPARDIEEEYTHRSWTRENGLPDNEVIGILQTRDGYLWVATPFALARFDGMRFVVFDQTTHPEMCKGRVRRMTEDNSATLWISTDDGIFGHNAAGFKLVPAATDSSLAQPITPDNRDGVWTCLFPIFLEANHVTTAGVISTNTIRFKTPAHSGYISSLVALPDGRFWVGDDMGAYLLDSTFQEVEKFQFPHVGFLHFPVLEPDGTGYDLVQPYPDNQKLAQLYRIQQGRAILCATNFINTWGRLPFLTRDQSGALWMPGGRRGLLRYAQGQMTRFRFPGGSSGMSYSREDRDGFLWLGGFACCAHSSRDGNLWFGTTDSGLHCLRPRCVRVLTVREGLTGTTPECLLQTRDGSVWIGTEDGLTRFDTSGCTSFDESHGLLGRVTHSLAEDQDGVLWVGTLRGLHSFDNGRFVHHAFPRQGDVKDRVRAIVPARTGGLWVAAEGGLVRVAKSRQIELTMQHGLRSKKVLSLLEEPSGVLWVGTGDGGLNRLSWSKAVQDGLGESLNGLTNVTVTVVSTTNGLSSNTIWTMLQDRDGVLWIGTDHGLSRYENGRCATFTVEQGLPENQVNELLEDESGCFWIGGDRSVYRVSRQDLNKIASGLARFVTPVSYDQSDGLPSLEVSGKLSHPAMCRTQDGRLWICTAGGVAILDPKKTSDSTSAPLVVIEQIRANGQIAFDNGPRTGGTASTGGPALAGDRNSQISNRKSNEPATAQRLINERKSQAANLKSTIHFAPGRARILEIQYTANSFVSPETTRFRYFLEGWDKGWIDAGTARKAYYANLRPGDYRFRVLAAGRNGRWSETEASVSFHLAPFYYETPWFYALCGAVLVSGSYLGVASRLRKTRRIAELERQVALNEQRKRIARDVHDELGASLTQIAQLTEELDTGPGQPGLGEAQTRRIAALAEEAVVNVGEIVWANNPRYDTLKDLVAYLREYAASYLGTASLETQLVFPEEVPDRAVTGLFRRYILAILKEALHNILKHSGAKRVEVRTVFTGEDLELTVRDDGVGFDPASQQRLGNGLVNIRERCAEFGGACEITSEPGSGTTIRANLPLS